MFQTDTSSVYLDLSFKSITNLFSGDFRFLLLMFVADDDVAAVVDCCSPSCAVALLLINLSLRLSILLISPSPQEVFVKYFLLKQLSSSRFLKFLSSTLSDDDFLL